jgi:hypothetical protein
MTLIGDCLPRIYADDRGSNEQLAISSWQLAKPLLPAAFLQPASFILISQITRFPDHARSPDLITLGSVISITSSKQAKTYDVLS